MPQVAQVLLEPQEQMEPLVPLVLVPQALQDQQVLLEVQAVLQVQLVVLVQPALQVYLELLQPWVQQEPQVLLVLVLLVQLV